MNGHPDFEHEATPQAVRSPVEPLLADARTRLIETGTRNRLVHTPRGGKRTRSLPIIGAEADSLFESLASVQTLAITDLKLDEVDHFLWAVGTLREI